MPDACATCGSTLGFYDGPNGYARCLNCMHDQGFKNVEPDAAVSPEPNAQVDDKAEDGPKNVMTTEGTVRDKAVRGPKESTAGSAATETSKPSPKPSASPSKPSATRKR